LHFIISISQNPILTFFSLYFLMAEMSFAKKLFYFFSNDLKPLVTNFYPAFLIIFFLFFIFLSAILQNHFLIQFYFLPKLVFANLITIIFVQYFDKDFEFLNQFY